MTLRRPLSLFQGSRSCYRSMQTSLKIYSAALQKNRPKYQFPQSAKWSMCCISATRAAWPVASTSVARTRRQSISSPSPTSYSIVALRCSATSTRTNAVASKNSSSSAAAASDAILCGASIQIPAAYRSDEAFVPRRTLTSEPEAGAQDQHRVEIELRVEGAPNVLGLA